MLYDTINSFRDEYDFLSNFYMARVDLPNGECYPSSEHAYQAQKTLDVGERLHIACLEKPGQAKREGAAVTLRSDWDLVRVRIMFDIVLLKFEQHSDLAAKLIATGDKLLEEGNHWNDKFWGTVDGKGRNVLGNILMSVRSILRDRRRVDDLNRQVMAYWVGDPMNDSPLSYGDVDHIDRMMQERDDLKNKLNQALAMHGPSDILTHYT